MTAKRGRGRPTDYTPALGEEILQLMAEGLSLTAAAAEMGFHRQRVYDWERIHPEFSDAVKLARAKRQLFLERRLLTEDSGPKITSTIFALKNAAPDDWKDKHEVENNTKLSADDSLAGLLARVAASGGKIHD